MLSKLIRPIRKSLVCLFILFVAWHTATAADFSFESIEKKYSPTKAPEGFVEFCKENGNENPNSCAIRLAYALAAIDEKFFEGTKPKSGLLWKKLPTVAADLAIILNGKFGKAAKVASRADIKDKKGIVFFDTITNFDGSGHIALWNGSAFLAGADDDYFKKSPRTYFWELK